MVQLFFIMCIMCILVACLALSILLLWCYKEVKAWKTKK